MYKLLILSSSTEGDLNGLEEQIDYLKRSKIDVTLCVDPKEIELLRILDENRFDCAYIHVKKRFIADSEAKYDPAKVLEQKNVPTLGNSYIVQMLIADKYATSIKSGMGLPGNLINRTAFTENYFNWDAVTEYPVIVKPNTLHASMGITEDSVISDKLSLKKAVGRLFDEFHFLHEVLIEKYAVNAQEYTVSVLGNGESLVCSVSKLLYKQDSIVKINSYTQKQLPLAERSFVFAKVEDEKIRQRLEYHAKTLFHHFNMKDIARFDFIVDKTYYLLEANTCPMPGNSFSWEWQEKYGVRKEQIIALFLIAFHFRQTASGKASRLPVTLFECLPKAIIRKIDHPSAVDTCPECSGPTDNCQKPHLYTMNDRVSSETEVHTFLNALTQLIKPGFILETGTYKGSSTIAFAEGLRKNAHGRMVTIEINAELAQRARELFLEYPVEVLNQTSLTYVPNEAVDLLFLDSKRDIRGEEFAHFLPYLSPTAIIVWHDSSYRVQNHSVYDVVESLYHDGIIDRVLFPTPRGLTISMLKVCKYD